MTDETTTMPSVDVPKDNGAIVHILQNGYVREDDAGQHVGSTISMIIDGPAITVVDPGMVASREDLLAAVRGHGIDPSEVTDVVFSHHHPDHTINAALFPSARIHDHWAIYEGDVWHDRPADGYSISPSVLLIATPGHSAEDISTVAATAAGVVVFTHAWWSAEGPAVDPFAPEQAVLEASRMRIAVIADQIVPGHGAPFVPGPP